MARHTQSVDHLHHFRELLGADVRAERKAKVDEHKLADEILVGARLAIVIEQLKRPSQFWLADLSRVQWRH